MSTPSRPRASSQRARCSAVCFAGSAGKSASKATATDDSDVIEGSPILQTKKNEKIDSALECGEIQVAAGTTWLWSRPELKGAVDVLFVDEAGQMSLADVLAVSQAARSLVLLGDPNSSSSRSRVAIRTGRRLPR